MKFILPFLLFFAACQSIPENLSQRDFIKKYDLHGVWGSEDGRNVIILDTTLVSIRSCCEGPLKNISLMYGNKYQFITDTANLLAKKDELENEDENKAVFLWLKKDALYYLYYENSISVPKIGKLFKYDLDMGSHKGMTSFNNFPQTKHQVWEVQMDSFIMYMQITNALYLYRHMPKEPELFTEYTNIPSPYEPYLYNYSYQLHQIGDKWLLTILGKSMFFDNDILSDYPSSAFQTSDYVGHFWLSNFDSIEEDVLFLDRRGETKNLVFKKSTDTLIEYCCQNPEKYRSNKTYSYEELKKYRTSEEYIWLKQMEAKIRNLDYMYGRPF